MIFKNPKNLVQNIEKLVADNSELSKQLEVVAKEKVLALRNELKNKVIQENGINIIAEKISIDSAGSVKDLAFGLKSEIDNLFMVIGAEISGKANVTVMISDNLVKEKNLNAGAIIREISKEIKGGGGGQPFFATAGGKDPNGLDKAIEMAKDIALNS